MKVIWSHDAASDYLQNIQYLLSNWPEKSASEFIEEVDSVLELIRLKPEIGINTGIMEEKMPKTAINLALRWLDEHKPELLENCERVQRKESLLKIQPLT